jgi:hypothetical protein
VSFVLVERLFPAVGEEAFLEFDAPLRHGVAEAPGILVVIPLDNPGESAARKSAMSEAMSIPLVP